MSEQDADGSGGTEPTDADDADPSAEPAADAEAESVDEGGEVLEDEQVDAVDEGDEQVDAADEELVARVRESDTEDVAHEIASLRTRIEGLEAEVDALEAELDERDAEIDDLTSKLKRKQADFENYKKRMKKRREDEKRRAAENLVARLLDVRDNLARALGQEEGADIRGGVESTLRQFDDVLAAENVRPIEPEPGAEVDPQSHQVLARVESDQPAGTIADVHRPGYEMADTVLREAQVTVSEQTDEGAGEADEDGASGTDE